MIAPTLIAWLAINIALVAWLHVRTRANPVRPDGPQHLDNGARGADWSERIARHSLEFRQVVHGFGSDEMPVHGEPTRNTGAKHHA